MPKFTNFAQPVLNTLSTTLQSLIESVPVPGLTAGPKNVELVDWLNQLEKSTQETKVTSLRGVSSERLDEWLSGLWLLAGDIDRSHSISQDIENPEGSFLHGIMHRREGDFSNAKYWFRRVGNHPVIEQLASETGGEYASGPDFVDQVMNSLQKDESAQTRCRDLQWMEWQALMVYCLN